MNVMSQVLEAEVARVAAAAASPPFPAHWSFHDTLPLARRALPGRSGKGSHTLGRLFEDVHGDADGGGGGATTTLEGAHDALVDAEALARVWRWLVEVGGCVTRAGCGGTARGRSVVLKSRWVGA